MVAIFVKCIVFALHRVLLFIAIMLFYSFCPCCIGEMNKIPSFCIRFNVMQFHFLWPDPGHCVKNNFTQCFANAIVFTLFLCVFSLSFARLSLSTLAFLLCFGIFSLHFYRPSLCLGIFMFVRISIFFCS